MAFAKAFLGDDDDGDDCEGENLANDLQSLLNQFASLHSKP